ncbi:hypothetical protein BH11MYX3_BH11MYX3_27170 [soil metagenome]
MRHLVLAAVLCAWMAGSANADGVVVTSSDHSESGLPEADRQANAETVKRVLDRFVETESLAADRQIDVGVVRLSVEPGDVELAVTAELRIAISDGRGQLVSVVSGTAKVSMPSAAYRARILPTLRSEALVAAVQAMLPKLRAHLHAAPRASVQRWTLVPVLDDWFARLSPPRG